jgi:glycolate oxidase iron-sulfur subunit
MASVTSRAGCRAAIPGPELQELTEAGTCCGSAGRYNLLHPAPAHDLAERQATVVLATGVRLVVTANPGCRMQVPRRWFAWPSGCFSGARRRCSTHRSAMPVGCLLGEVLDGPGWPVSQGTGKTSSTR